MSGRRLLGFLLAGGAVYLAVLLWTFPAPWVAHAVEMASERRLLLRDVAGSVWRGSGRLYARARSGALVDLGAVGWRASGPALLMGRLGVELALGEPARTVQVEASLNGLTLRGVDIEVPGSLVAELAPALAALGPEGAVRLRADSLRVEGDSVLGAAEIEWRALRLTRAQDLALGSHVARLRGAGSRVEIELGTLEGPLRLTGAGTWTRAAGLVLSGRAEPRNAEVVPFLKAVCAEYRDTGCHFRYSGA